MRITVAESAGFCFGVSRAVDTVEKTARQGGQVVTLGPIIHNRHVVQKFQDLGVAVIDSPEQAQPGMTVIIRSHGVSRAVMQALQDRQVEIIDAKWEILEGSWIAEPMDATALLASADLINNQNKLCAFNGMTVEAIEYKNGEPGDDIYVTLGKDGASYSFCVEVYLTGTESEVYKTVGTLVAGDTVDVEAFLYWYEGANPHITKITKK